MPKPPPSRFARLKDTLLSFVDERRFLRPEGGDATRLQHFIHFWVQVGTSFVRNRGPLRATALTYTTTLALVPILAVGLGVSTWMLKGESGRQAVKEFVDKLVDEAAPQLGLMPHEGFGAAKVVAEDIRDLPGFIAQLREPTNLISRYVWPQLSRTNQQRLSSLAAEGDDRKDLKQALATELSRIIQAGPLFDERRFAEVKLSPGTKALLGSGADDAQSVLSLNRSLLEDAYPGHLLRSAGTEARSEVKERLQSFIATVHSGTLGVTGTIGLIIIAVGLLINIEGTFNDIWGVKHGRSWSARVFQYWGTLTLGPLMIIFAMGLSVTAKIHKIQHLIQKTLPVIGDWVIATMVFLAPFAILLLVFMVLYVVIPNTSVEWSAAFVGSLVASVLWHLNNWANVLFASRVITASKIYGPLSVVPVFLIGLYFSWLILLFGAQVAYTFQNRRAFLQERQTETVNQRGREFVALRLAACVGERFQTGTPAPTAREIAETLGVPVRLIYQVGDALLASGLLTRVATEEVAYTPGRPLERISCHDVLIAMRAGQGHELATSDSPARSLVRSEYERIEEAERRVASSVSLLQVVNRLPTHLEVLSSGAPDAKDTAGPRQPEAGQPETASSKEPDGNPGSSP